MMIRTERFAFVAKVRIVGDHDRYIRGRRDARRRELDAQRGRVVLPRIEAHVGVIAGQIYETRGPASQLRR
jgi:hypothetical protein